MIDGEKGKAFTLDETGWGEFEITMKLYYASDSGEKAQTIYHHLRLHPYGKTDEEKARSRQPNGDVISWNYEEQIFNEPYEAFFDVLTSGAHSRQGKKGAALDPAAGIVYERSALVPRHLTAEQPFSRETEEIESQRIRKALETVQGWIDQTKEGNVAKEKELVALKKENAAASGT